MSKPENRIFVTCGAGFVLAGTLPTLLKVAPDARLTLLLLARSQADADRYLERLLDFTGIHRRCRARIRAVAGDLRQPGLGIADPRIIDSNYWLNGTLPFKFGRLRPVSLRSAEKTIDNYLGLLNAYEASVEPVEHYVQLSSIRVGGQSSNRLPESLRYNYVAFGNFDSCKRLVEDRLQSWFEMPAPRPRTSVVRIASLLSPKMTRIGGGVLLLSKELLGFGRYPEWPTLLPGDAHAVLRFTPADVTSRAIAMILFSPPENGIQVLNLSNNYDKVTVSEYIDVITEVRRVYAPAKSAHLSLVHKCDPVHISDFDHQKRCKWLLETFGWLILQRCTFADPEIASTENLLGRPWFTGADEVGQSIKLLEQAVSAAIEARFVASPPDFGETPIY